MIDCCREVIGRWSSLPNSTEVDMLNEMARLTARIIGRTVFGDETSDEEAKQVVQGFSDYQHNIDQLSLADTFGLPILRHLTNPIKRRRCQMSGQRVHDVIDRIIARQKTQPSAKKFSLISLFVEGHKGRDGQLQGCPLSRIAARNEAIVMFMAGHETTANVLAWTWYLLDHNPRVASALHEELDRVLEGRTPSLDDVPNLPYTRAVFKYLMAKCLGRLPVELTSDIGGYLGKKQAAKSIQAKRLWIDRLRYNLEHLCDIKDPVEREQRLIVFISNIGRRYAEYMSLQKIVQQGRLEIVGKDILDKQDKQVIVVSCHLSHWELVGYIGAYLGRPGCDLYLGLENPVREQLALEARSGWSLSHMHIPASPYCLRPITKALNEGRNFLIFIDEMRHEYVSAPSLGRDIPYAGNRWFASRLAVKHHLDILPIYVLPNGKGRYKVVVEPLIKSANFDGSNDDKAKSIADQLDTIINRCVSDNLEHWYWLPYYDERIPFPTTAGAI